MSTKPDWIRAYTTYDEAEGPVSTPPDSERRVMVRVDGQAAHASGYYSHAERRWNVEGNTEAKVTHWANEPQKPVAAPVAMSDKALADEVRRRLTRTDITDAQLVSELRRRIGHLDREECYEVIAMIGKAERDAMLASEVCDGVAFLLGLARGDQ